jgi:hypothetical protein
VHSSARAQAAVTARAKKLGRAREDLRQLERGLGSRHYPDDGKASARIAVITAGRRVGACLQAEADSDPGTGKPTLTWAFDQQAIDAEAAADGWHALLTNLPPGEADAVICLALLIFCLVERQVRYALAEQDQTRVEGLYAGRPLSPPDGSSSMCSASTHGNSADNHPHAEHGASSWSSVRWTAPATSAERPSRVVTQP